MENADESILHSIIDEEEDAEEGENQASGGLLGLDKAAMARRSSALQLIKGKNAQKDLELAEG